MTVRRNQLAASEAAAISAERRATIDRALGEVGQHIAVKNKLGEPVFGTHKFNFDRNEGIFSHVFPVDTGTPKVIQDRSEIEKIRAVITERVRKDHGLEIVGWDGTQASRFLVRNPAAFQAHLASTGPQRFGTRAVGCVLLAASIPTILVGGPYLAAMGWATYKAAGNGVYKVQIIPIPVYP
jgi:hypothetical protein